MGLSFCLGAFDPLAHTEGNQLMLLSCIDVSLSLFLSPFLFLKAMEKMSLDEDFKKKDV